MTILAKPGNLFYKIFAVAAIVASSPIWVPLLLLWAAFYALSSGCIYLAIWLLWLPRSKHILFVYSDSPIWRDQIEQNILPLIRERAVILNWSERRIWSSRFSLARTAFKHFGGRRDFNPMGVVFRPFRRARIFRFLPPFHDFKRGNPQSLSTMRQEFLEYSRVVEV